MAAAPARRAVLGFGQQVGAHPAGVQHTKTTEFFREVLRCVPSVVRIYKLEELTSAGELRRNIGDLFRKYSHVTQPEVIDMLIYKGREELEVRRREGSPPAASAAGGRPPQSAARIPPPPLLHLITSPAPVCSHPQPTYPQSIILNHKQRHHLIGQYLHDPMTDKVKKPSGLSPFLEAFYKSN